MFEAIRDRFQVKHFALPDGFKHRQPSTLVKEILTGKKEPDQIQDEPPKVGQKRDRPPEEDLLIIRDDDVQLDKGAYKRAKE